MCIPHAALPKLWFALDWQSVAASRAGGRGLREDVDTALLQQEFAGFPREDARPPPALLHPEHWPSARGCRLLDVTGIAEAVQQAPVVGLWRWAVSQQKPNKKALEEISKQGALRVPKADILQRFLQLPLPRSKLLHLVQEFMSMCLISQAEVEGRAQIAGLYRELPEEQKAFFASVNLTEAGVLVVRKICSNWACIEALAKKQVPEMPEPEQQEPEEPPLVQVHTAIEAYPIPPNFVVPHDKSVAFSAAILLTSRALQDCLLSLRVARLCKGRARALFQAQDFGQALAFYRLGQWHCPCGDSTLFSNASLCCSRLAKPHAAVEQAANALLIDDKNAKAAHSLLKAEIALGYSDCNDWQLDVLGKLGQTFKTVAELLEEHRKLPATDLSILQGELGVDLHKPLEVPESAEPRLFYLLAEEGQGQEVETGDLRHRLLTAALLGGSVEALLPATQLLSQSQRLQVLEEIAQAPLLINMEAALAIGQETDDRVTAFLHLAVAAASQSLVVLGEAGKALVDHLLVENHGKWKTGSPYGTWLMAFGGQSRRISELMSEALHIEKEGDIVSFRPKP